MPEGMGETRGAGQGSGKGAFRVFKGGLRWQRSSAHFPYPIAAKGQLHHVFHGGIGRGSVILLRHVSPETLQAFRATFPWRRDNIVYSHKIPAAGQRIGGTSEQQHLYNDTRR
jgi:hypothetical protein